MRLVRSFKRLLVWLSGLLCVAVGALLGVCAVTVYLAAASAEGHTIAAVGSALAVLLWVIGPRWVRGGRKVRPLPAHETTPAAMEDAEQEWEDPGLILDNSAPWRPWTRKGRLHRAIRERRYIRVA